MMPGPEKSHFAFHALLYFCSQRLILVNISEENIAGFYPGIIVGPFTLKPWERWRKVATCNGICAGTDAELGKRIVAQCLIVENIGTIVHAAVHIIQSIANVFAA